MCFIIEQTDHTLKGEQGLWVRENMQIVDSMDIFSRKKISSSKVERTQYTKKSVRMYTVFGEISFWVRL